MSAFLLILYFLLLGILATAGLHRLVAVGASLRYWTKTPTPSNKIPRLLVQLPVYNEAFVIERLLQSVAKMRYNPDYLLIQVLDDSTDSTRTVVDRVVQKLQSQQIPIEVVRRPNRDGYKAGALAEGLKLCPDVDAVAIFDADFVPPSDFLEQMVPRLFEADDIGLVQARWGHLNRDSNLLTRAQGVFLDGHFAVEHAARVVLGHPFNFNGTAGIWRKAAIEDAGGWQSDTITEDLDLSYRAQLEGWRFVYIHDVVAPAELPESWAAFRGQQARWVRGSVETARKLLSRVIRSRRLGTGAKLDALFHLTNNFAYAFSAALAGLLPVVLVLREELGWRVPGGRSFLSVLDISMLGAGTLALLIFYQCALFRTTPRAILRIGDILIALCIGAGMSLANTLAVIRGLTSKQSVFVRTPKKGESSKSQGYVAHSTIRLIFLEGCFSLYFAGAVIYAVQWSVWGALPFLLLYFLGFLTLSIGSAIEAFSAVASEEVPEERTAQMVS